MKTFQDFIDEGVYDPGIFKAFFTAGGPGSGKSYVASSSGAGKNNPYGLKVVDSDPLFSKMLKDLTFSPEDIMSPEGQAARQKAKAITGKRLSLAINGRNGIVVDGTGKDLDKIMQQAIQMKKLGYDTAMIFVNTDLPTALSRNKERPRTLPDDIVKSMWTDVQKNIGAFSTFFGPSFNIIDNSEGSDVFTKVFVEIGKLIKQKPSSRAANAWIKNQHAINRGG